MKIVFTILMAFPLISFANSFNNFTGSYDVASTPQIENINAGSCTRYAFKSLEKVIIVKDNSGYQQSHIIKFVTKLNNSPFTVSHPIMDYRNELGVFNPKDIVNYAKTTGSTSFASNEIGTQTPNLIEKHIVSIKKVNGTYQFEMVEKLLNSNGNHLCTYRVELNK